MQQVVAGSMMAPTRPCAAPCRVRPFTSAPRPMRAAPVVRQLAAPCRAVTVMSAAPAEAGPLKIRIKLKSYWVDLLQHSVELIKEAADSTGARIAGPVPLPTHRKIYTVLRSPHVNKDSREQFETRLHQRLIDVKDLSAETVDKLMQLDIPAGVDVQVKL